MILSGGTNGNFVINNDDIYTPSQDVTLTTTFSSSDHPQYMRFSNDEINRSDREEYTGSFSWPLSSDYGDKTVYVEFDGDGDYSGDVSTNDTITYIHPLLYIYH